MREILSDRRWLHRLAFFASLSLILISAYSDDSSTPKSGSKNENHSGSKGSTILICLLVVAVAVLSFFLYRYWQKKKRDEQYARLLKLFEADDELELELGLRD